MLLFTNNHVVTRFNEKRKTAKTFVNLTTIMSESDDSDYVVEQYIRPTTCSVPLRNDESADLLGNFDDSKRKNIEIDGDNNSDGGSDEILENGEGNSDESDVDNEMEVNNSTDSRKVKSKKTVKEYDGKISQDQITSLLRGSTKANRFVLYVTNLNFGTSKERLTEYFSTSGNVKTVRIPKKRKGGFAFVEMSDVDGFKVCILVLFKNFKLLNLSMVQLQNAFSLHNTMLDDRPIKIQLSEAGKKKSANKKNILKQKNRKLAEMRNEVI